MGSQTSLQELAEIAKNVNKCSRESLAQVATAEQQVSDQQLVAASASQVGNCLSFMGDENFAISEDALESARNSCDGNWLKLESERFSESFGQSLCDDASESDSDTEDPSCQSQLCPGVCRRDLTQAYFSLFDEVKDLLRSFRTLRRQKGFVPHHPLLLFCNKNSKQIASAFLLGRVSFSPFDATVVELEQCAHLTYKMAVSSTKPNLLPLPSLLYRLQSQTDRLDLKTCEYTVISLGELLLDEATLQSSYEALRAITDKKKTQHDEQDDGDSDAGNMGQLHRLLKKAAAKNKPNKPGKECRKRKGSNQPVSAISKKPRVTVKANKTRPSEDVGEAARVSNELMVAWGEVVIEQHGPICDQQGSSSSKSTSEAAQQPQPKQKPVPASSSASKSDAVPAVPIVSYTQPWRDSKGYCWVYNPDTKKPSFLGLVLRFE